SHSPLAVGTLPLVSSSGPASRQARVKILEAPHHRLAAELFASLPPGRGAKLAGQVAVLEQSADRRGQLSGVSWGNQQSASPGAKEATISADLRRNNGAAGRHVLQDRVRHPLRP